MDILDKAEQFMADAFTQSNNPIEIDHHQRTVAWIKWLKPDADETLLVAGMLHDIERAFNGDWKAGSIDEDMLTKHQQLSSSEAEKFLIREHASSDVIAVVTDLILNHETGGTQNQNVLCDSDCLAWLEEKAPRNALKYKAQGNEDMFRDKLNSVLSRIHSPRARAKAEELYHNAIEVLA